MKYNHSMRLSDPVTDHFRLTDAHKAALDKLGLRTVRDLLFHLPSRYEQGGGETTIAGLVSGQDVSVIGKLERLETKKSWKSRIPLSEGYIRDQSGRIKVRWFNQPYIAKMYTEGSTVKAVGKVSGSEGKLYLANPQLEKVAAVETGLFAKHKSPLKKSGPPESPEGRRRTGDPRTFSEDFYAKMFAVYPESRGVSSLWIRHAVEKILKEVLEEVEDPLPQSLLKKYNLPTLKTALVWAHMPEKPKDADAARKRFAFEEVFLIQLERQQEKLLQSRETGFVVDVEEAQIDQFMSHFPFNATKAQQKAIGAILDDMRHGHPMSRLLEGDVGSGKTAVAATAAYAVVSTRPPRPDLPAGRQEFGTLQVAYMAPTEILAKQHFESFIKYFEQFPINIGLITGSGCYKFPSKVKRGAATNISRVQLLKWVAAGEVPVVIGTHALIQKSIIFKHLALVVIDEQHRFGTAQRKRLAKKKGEAHLPAGRQVPHLLSMTATPIPRTLALTLYGDLDLTLLDEMPAGRKQIITEVVPTQKRSSAYEKIRAQLKDGRQAYVICPRIDEPDPQKEFALQAKSVKEEARRLKKDVFPEYEIDILHSKMTPKEKDDVMKRFSNHEIDILVATSVVEVGVNVPNATVIMIEGAERFGLAQLHQLRGRVVRSNHQAYCFVVPETKSEPTVARLKSLTTAKNGFELAEQDLLQRGAGTLSGGKQWGISDVGMEALKNLKLVEAARTEALDLVTKDETLERHPLLRSLVSRQQQHLHLE